MAHKNDYQIQKQLDKPQTWFCKYYPARIRNVGEKEIADRQLVFEPEGVYYPIWQAMQDDETLTAVVRSRQLHIYRNGKKILVLAGKAQPKIIREDKIQELITRL